MLNLPISPEGYRLGLGDRGSVQLLVNNVLSGLDQTLHGSNRLHGWGQFAFADPTLLTVRGFDPTTSRFKYTVNPLFGSSAQFRNTFRSPFMLTLDARIEVGPDRETQFLDALLRLRPADGTSQLTFPQIKARIARGFNPIDQLLLVKDSLKLSTGQVDTIKGIAQKFAVTRDSIVTSIARYLESRHGDYHGEDVRQRCHAAGIASYRAYLGQARLAIAALTAEQRERSKTVPQLQGILSIEQIKDAGLSSMFRSPLAALP
ncbi:MAG: hypothetical protein JWM41_2021 [Gemmatimonadetes bacterium]|nr:hypothetical protein [Gemmatimonadota bacterium]